MPGSDIAARVERYFERQIAWLEESVGAMRSIEAHFSEAEIEALERQQAGLARQTEQLTRECEALLREWENAADVSEAARTAVRGRAGQAAELIAELQRRYVAAAVAADGELVKLKQASSALRRGRDAVQSYRPGGDEAPGFVDRKA